MNQSSTIQAPRRWWLICIVALAGALLGQFAIALPANSADLYGYESYPAPYYQGAGYRQGCERCGCERCGCISRCYPHSQVIERRVVEREYYERRLGCCGERRVECCGERRIECCGVYGGGYPWRSAYEEPRYNPFPYGYGGVRRPPYAAYEYDAPRPPAPVYYDGYQ